jgi:hypothetical protein
VDDPEVPVLIEDVGEDSDSEGDNGHEDDNKSREIGGLGSNSTGPNIETTMQPGKEHEAPTQMGAETALQDL